MSRGDAEATRALLLDVEGTTTPVDFVYNTLFPYARQRLREFVASALAAGMLGEEIEALRGEHAADVDGAHDPPRWSEASLDAKIASIAAYLGWLMDRDRKSTPLKTIQGMIWESGFRAGELRGQVYPDVPPALERWRGQARDIAIFSSGSTLAQRLLFGSSTGGDLTAYIRDYFDTTIGPKHDSASYLRIAERLGMPPEAILFVSDTPGEIEAARAARMQTALCVRQGAAPQGGSQERMIRTFDELFGGTG